MSSPTVFGGRGVVQTLFTISWDNALLRIQLWKEKWNGRLIDDDTEIKPLMSPRRMVL